MLTTDLTAGEQMRAIPGENDRANEDRAEVDRDRQLRAGHARAHQEEPRHRPDRGRVLCRSRPGPGPAGAPRSSGSGDEGRARRSRRSATPARGRSARSRVEDREPRAKRSRADRACLRRALPAFAHRCLRASKRFGSMRRESSKSRLVDAVGSRDLLVQAVAADPSNAVARSALAAAWSALGYDARARDEAKRAADLSASLPREQRLAVQARYRALAGDPDKAIQAYAELRRAVSGQSRIRPRPCRRSRRWADRRRTR